MPLPNNPIKRRLVGPLIFGWISMAAFQDVTAGGCWIVVNEAWRV
ncbi:MAG: hypothetical protein OJF51_000447 [Nitrospira sp.]|nr:MAG: hypothetical protein OJF51_000447 [Nitrospira sp.]